MGQRLVDVRVERLAGCTELGQAEPAHDPLQRVGDGLEAAFHLAVLAGPVDVVEHREQRRERAVRRVLPDQVTVAVDASLVVDVLGLQPLQVRGALRQLALDGILLDLDLGVICHLCGRVAEAPVGVQVLRLEGSALLDPVVDTGDVLQLMATVGRPGVPGPPTVRLLGHLDSPSVGPSSSTISASTTSASSSAGACWVASPVASAGASALAYIAAPIFWLDSPSLVIAATNASVSVFSSSSSFFSASTSDCTSDVTSSGSFSALSAMNFSVL